MFNFFKGLFGQSKAQEEVYFSDVGIWFETKLKESSLSKELSELFNEINRASAMLAVSIKKIARKVIENEIPAEHKGTIDEYRDDYIAKLQNFLKQINLERKDPASILNYYENLSAALEQTKDSTKNHFSVIQKFFDNEAVNITEAMNLLIDSKSKLDKLIKKENGVKYVSDVQKLIQIIKKKNKLLMELKERIERDEVKKKESEKYRDYLETELDDLKTAEEYSKYDQLISKQMRLEKELEREEQNISILFSPILKLLFEYDKKEMGADRALARQYASSPIQSLHNDKGLWILTLLQSVSSKLPELEQNEQKRIKVRQSILAINETILKDYLAKRSLIQDAVSNVKRQIMSNNTTTKIGDVNYKMKHVDEQVKTAEENRKKHENEISTLNPEKDLLMLEKKLSLLGKVKII